MYARLPDGKTSLFQWDTKQYLEVSEDVTRVDFCFRIAPEVVYGVFAKDGKCYIPNLLIQKAGIVDALIMSTEIGTTTDRRLEIPVVERPIPPGYVATKDGAIISYDDLEDVIGELNFLSTNGGTMAGDINMDGRKITGLVDPVEDGDAARKRYVDTEISTAAGNAKKASLPRAGGTMTGNIDLGGNALTNVKSPAADADAATKGYVDERIVTYQNISVPASAWGSGATFAGATRTKYADIALAGVTSGLYATVTFNPDDIDNYNLAGICATKDGKITIYAEYAPSVAITIPTIICLKD
ncbi:MAG: hypothetical protein SPE19_10420 [Candidatus Faecousia sp.]|nr:hypothetical protein [Candidatus Faecousia sp.]